MKLILKEELMIYQVVNEKVNHFEELKKILGNCSFSFRPHNSAKDQHIFTCFKDKLPFKEFPLTCVREGRGITIEENGKIVKISGNSESIVEYFKQTSELDRILDAPLDL